MKKYLLSSPSFTGTIELLYVDGENVLVDFRNSVLSFKQKHWFLRNVAVLEIAIEEMVVAMKSVTCVQEDYVVSLDDFKREYPYQRNSHLLPPIWEKLSKSVQVMCVVSARKYRKWCEREKQKNPNYTPKIAAGWLRERQYINDWDNL